MILKNSILILGFLLVISLGDLCISPQKQFYLSYDAIGNREYLTDMFQNISLSLPQYNMSYTDKNGSVYQIVNLHPHLYYNEHRQTEAYHDQYSVNVTLGQLYMAYRFDFKMRHQDKNVTGWARGRTLVDQNSFLKEVILIDGALEWNAVSIPLLDISSQFSVQYSEPKFTQNQTAFYIQLLNDYLGTQKIKQNIIKKTNQLYASNLRYHLNHEQILKNSSIEYKYGNLTFNYINVIKEFKMNNAQTKGLEVFLLFGLQDGKQQCIDLPKDFDEESYGGVQQLISMGTIRLTIEQAASKGLFDAMLDKKYEVPFFQFFMGDLGNFVEYADRLPAHDSFDITCQFSRQRADQLKIRRHDQHDLYIQVPEQCKIYYKSQPVMRVSFDMNLVVRIVAENDSLMVKISSTGVYGDKYFALDPNFVVTNPYNARYALQAVLNGLIGKNGFGTGWPTFTRKYPVLRVLDDYIVIFDASQK